MRVGIPGETSWRLIKVENKVKIAPRIPTNDRKKPKINPIRAVILLVETNPLMA
jgi:hypothetical protein